MSSIQSRRRRLNLNWQKKQMEEKQVEEKQVEEEK